MEGRWELAGLMWLLSGVTISTYVVEVVDDRFSVLLSPRVPGAVCSQSASMLWYPLTSDNVFVAALLGSLATVP